MHEPEANPAVTGGEGDEDARIVSGTQHQMRRDRALAHQTVGVETFIDLVVEPLRGGLERECRAGREQPRIDDQRGRSQRCGLS